MSDRPPFPLRKVITSGGIPRPYLPSLALMLSPVCTGGTRVPNPREPFRVLCLHGHNPKVKLSQRQEGTGLSVTGGLTGRFPGRPEGRRERSARFSHGGRSRRIPSALPGEFPLGRLERGLG